MRFARIVPGLLLILMALTLLSGCQPPAHHWRLPRVAHLQLCGSYRDVLTGLSGL